MTTTTRSTELMEQAEKLTDQGKDEQAAEVAHLASYGVDDGQEDESRSQTASGTIGLLASEVETLELEWVWKHWIPKQFVGIFVGDSGIGKSSVLRELVKRLTRGDKLPDGQFSGDGPQDRTQGDPMGVVIISYEEPTETVLVPRLRESGADLSKVKILSKVQLRGNIGEPSERAFRVPEDLGLLREAIAQVDAGVVFIDPLMSMTDKAIARNQTAREILDALQDVAIETSAAIVIIAHLNKGKSREMRQRMNSSKAFYDMPRFIMAAAQDTSNPSRATMWMDKHSLCGEVPSVTYERMTDGSIHFISGHVEAARAEYIKEEENRTDQLILDFLTKQPGREFQARTIALSVRVTYDAARKQLQRLAHDGRILRTERGWYKEMRKNEDVSEKNTTKIGTNAMLSQDLANIKTSVIAPTNGHIDNNATTEVLV